MDNLKLNDELKKHSYASLRSYRIDDPYKQAIKDMKTVNNRRAQKFVQRDKKLGRQKRLLPSKKV